MKVIVRFDTENGTLHPSKEKILETLKENQVTAGIDEKAIDGSMDSFASFVAAVGTKPVNGKDARIEKNFDLTVKGHPKLVGHDRVDYKDMNLFVLTKKDDMLLVRIPQTEGTPGEDVFGRTLPARNGKPLPMPAGKNTEVRNENELYATIDGQIVAAGKKIEVDPHFVVKGGVGVGTGNVDFTGSVEVDGSVEEGFSVKATGDVHISGNINGGSVTAKNVYVDGGILGKDNSRVFAAEDVRAAFTEHANVEARRDIFIADTALHSVLRAGEHIICEDKRGQIMGGNLTAGLEIRAKLIGTPSQVKTSVSVGVDPALEERHKAHLVEQKEGREALKKIKLAIKTMDKIPMAKLPPAKQKILAELKRSQFPLAGRLKRIALDLEDEEKALSGITRGRITARDRIYPEVVVQVCHVKKTVESPIITSTVSLRDDELDIAAYQGV